ncbi:wax ester/triacylglycerol synthase domain-containing protein [Rhodococcus chondri]|uniref:diacylglycerol O-acyltransferase n=1 Tax=Rhodococcus chondri TaxID=3065941 RepID=A0ABU7JRQ9_9NOCA|nr:wax ester/triacylglycerol synthase domain-containing protein [Rhodococcus sp. CC-R104]MEE2032189.1 wax ester/triacylglycerol synthase family O-acyltransferase [Rhodococcus sp. CC-R104]
MWVFGPGDDIGDSLEHAEIVEWVSARLSRSRVFTDVVEFHTPLAYPSWRSVADVRVEEHIHCIDLDGGGWGALRRELVRILAAPMDLRRPLWEIYALTGSRAVPGIEDGSTFMALKFHHAMGDGVEAVAIGRKLFDAPDAPVGADDGDENSMTPPGFVRQVGALPGQLAKMFRAARRARKAVAELDSLDIRGELPSLPTARPNRFNQLSRNADLVFDLARWPLGTVQAARAALPGATVNDFALAVIAGAVRAYLGEHDELDGSSVVVAVPMSLTPVAARATAKDEVSNQFGMILVDLQVDEPDPLVRFAGIVAGTMHGKRRSRSPQVLAATTALDDYPWWAAKRVIASTRRAVKKGTSVAANALVTNVPRGSADVQMCGRSGISAFGVVSVQPGLAFAVASLGDELTISFTATRAAIPGSHRFRELLDDSFAELVGALQGSKENRSDLVN